MSSYGTVMDVHIKSVCDHIKVASFPNSTAVSFSHITSLLENDLSEKVKNVWRYKKEVLQCLHRYSIAPRLLEYLPASNDDVLMRIETETRMRYFSCITSILERMIRAAATIRDVGIKLEDLFMQYPRNTIMKFRNSIEDVICYDMAMYEKNNVVNPEMTISFLRILQFYCANADITNAEGKIDAAFVRKVKAMYEQFLRAKPDGQKATLMMMLIRLLTNVNASKFAIINSIFLLIHPGSETGILYMYGSNYSIQKQGCITLKKLIENLKDFADTNKDDKLCVSTFQHVKDYLVFLLSYKKGRFRPGLLAKRINSIVSLLVGTNIEVSSLVTLYLREVVREITLKTIGKGSSIENLFCGLNLTLAHWRGNQNNMQRLVAGVDYDVIKVITGFLEAHSKEYLVSNNILEILLKLFQFHACSLSERTATRRVFVGQELLVRATLKCPSLIEILPVSPTSSEVFDANNVIKFKNFTLRLKILCQVIDQDNIYITLPSILFKTQLKQFQCYLTAAYKSNTSYELISDMIESLFIFLRKCSAINAVYIATDLIENGKESAMGVLTMLLLREFNKKAQVSNRKHFLEWCQIVYNICDIGGESYQSHVICVGIDAPISNMLYESLGKSILVGDLILTTAITFCIEILAKTIEPVVRRKIFHLLLNQMMQKGHTSLRQEDEARYVSFLMECLQCLKALAKYVSKENYNMDEVVPALVECLMYIEKTLSSASKDRERLEFEKLNILLLVCSLFNMDGVFCRHYIFRLKPFHMEYLITKMNDLLSSQDNDFEKNMVFVCSDFLIALFLNMPLKLHMSTALELCSIFSHIGQFLLRAANSNDFDSSMIVNVSTRALYIGMRCPRLRQYRENGCAAHLHVLAGTILDLLALLLHDNRYDENKEISAYLLYVVRCCGNISEAHVHLLTQTLMQKFTIRNSNSSHGKRGEQDDETVKQNLKTEEQRREVKLPTDKATDTTPHSMNKGTIATSEDKKSSEEPMDEDGEIVFIPIPLMREESKGPGTMNEPISVDTDESDSESTSNETSENKAYIEQLEGNDFLLLNEMLALLTDGAEYIKVRDSVAVYKAILLIVYEAINASDPPLEKLTLSSVLGNSSRILGKLMHKYGEYMIRNSNQFRFNRTLEENFDVSLNDFESFLLDHHVNHEDGEVIDEGFEASRCQALCDIFLSVDKEKKTDSFEKSMKVILRDVPILQNDVRLIQAVSILKMLQSTTGKSVSIQRMDSIMKFVHDLMKSLRSSTDVTPDFVATTNIVCLRILIRIMDIFGERKNEEVAASFRNHPHIYTVAEVVLEWLLARNKNSDPMYYRLAGCYLLFWEENLQKNYFNIESLGQKFMWLIGDLSLISPQICENGCRFLTLLLKKYRPCAAIVSFCYGIAVAAIGQYNKEVKIVINALRLVDMSILIKGGIPKVKIKAHERVFAFRDMEALVPLLRQSENVAIEFLHLVITVIRVDISLITVDICCTILSLLKQLEDPRKQVTQTSNELLGQLRKCSSLLHSCGHSAFLLAAEGLWKDMDKTDFHKMLITGCLNRAKLDNLNIAKEMLKKRKALEKANMGEKKFKHSVV